MVGSCERSGYSNGKRLGAVQWKLAEGRCGAQLECTPCVGKVGLAAYAIGDSRGIADGGEHPYKPLPLYTIGRPRNTKR